MYIVSSTNITLKLSIVSLSKIRVGNYHYVKLKTKVMLDKVDDESKMLFLLFTSLRKDVIYL